MKFPRLASCADEGWGQSGKQNGEQGDDNVALPQLFPWLWLAELGCPSSPSGLLLLPAANLMHGFVKTAPGEICRTRMTGVPHVRIN